MIAYDLEKKASVSVDIGGNSVSYSATQEPPEKGLYLSPGWIDIQVNGYMGVDLNSGEMTLDKLEFMTQKLHEVGVTRFLPTVITQSAEHMERCLKLIVQACEASPLVKEAVAGIHLEGPFISPEDGARGAHPLEHVKAPTIDLFERLQEAANGMIDLVTLAPEHPGSFAFIRYLVDQNITVALGHTLASPVQIAEAVSAGATLSTHLGNGAPATMPRHPNVIWDQLAEPQLYASAIFDGFHLPDSVMRVLYKVKGPDRLILTSDAVALAGMAAGVYTAPVGGKVELHENNRLTMFGTQYLAGSASSLLDGVNNLMSINSGDVLNIVAAIVAAVHSNPRELLKLPEKDDQVLFRVDTQNEVKVLAVTRADKILYKTEV